MTYARGRLMVGMSGVGTVVALAAGALLAGWPRELLPSTPGPIASEAVALAAVLLSHAALLAPFDLFGGLLLPRQFERTRSSLTEFLGRWLRAIGVQLSVVLGAALLILAAGRAGGRPLAAATFVGVMLALVVGQALLARAVSGLKVTRRNERVELIRARDPGFTGGVVGLPGRERFLVPERWVDLLGADGVDSQLARWRASIDSGGRSIGVLVALLWNLAGFVFATWLPGAGVTTVAGLVTTALGFTLWCFLGLLLLPSLSRPAVFANDRMARDRAVDTGTLLRTLALLDQLQDDEPRRTATVETIFHPIPALSRRVAALGRNDAPRFGAWHAARVALFLSWAGFGLLSRAVHCNSGRPELWALLPCD